MHRSRAAPSKQHATLATNSAEGKALALENEMPMRRVTRSQSREIEGSWGRLRTGQYGGTSDGRKTGKDGDGEGELVVFSCLSFVSGQCLKGVELS